MASSSSQLRSATEWVGPEITRLRLVCQVLARGVIRCRLCRVAEERSGGMGCANDDRSTSHSSPIPGITEGVPHPRPRVVAPVSPRRGRRGGLASGPAHEKTSHGGERGALERVRGAGLSVDGELG